jgi:hypothetical protein
MVTAGHNPNRPIEMGGTNKCIYVSKEKCTWK